MKRKILVVDIGGSSVKLMLSKGEVWRAFESGANLRPREAVRQIKQLAGACKPDAISIGFPAPVRNDKILKDPKHLGKGWAGFNFASALGRPARVINDAALQALGSYRGEGRMLFLGLGTGLGSALVWKGQVLSLELGHLPYVNHAVIEDELGTSGLERLGRRKWLREVMRAVVQLKIALIADRVVLGGGNA